MRRNVSRTPWRVATAAALLGLVIALSVVFLGPDTDAVSTPGGTAPAGPLTAGHRSPAPAAGVPATIVPAADHLDGTTVVSLTFDVGHAEQREAARTLDELGLAGTFYVTSGFVGQPGYLSRKDLLDMQAEGHEVGGHTKTLGRLPSLLPAEAARQTCDGRRELLDWGLDVRSFSYPFGSGSRDAEAIVSDCGYTSARAYGRDVGWTGCTDTDCLGASPLPAREPFGTVSTEPVTADWTLADLQAAVIHAEEAARGDWLQLTFQRIGAEDGGLAPEVLREFSTWLAARTSGGSLAVRPVREVIGGALEPAVAAPADRPPAAGENAVRNPGLETRGEYGLPQCWRVDGWGENTTVYSLTDQARSGDVAEQITVTDHTDGDAKLLPVMDFGGCSPSVAPGRSYSLRAWYISTGLTQFDVYYRTAEGGWLYWTSSPYFTPTEEYAPAEWTTPPVPDEAEGISFGLNIFSEGQLITDDYALYDSEGAPAPSPVTGGD